MGELTFKSWQRSGWFENTAENPLEKKDGRLQKTISITLQDTNIDEPPETGKTVITLLAPEDVVELKKDSIKHMAPAPFTADAETTKLVHIDFWEPGLPWRFTPEININENQVRPWIVLLTGTATEIQLKGDYVNVQDQVLLDHDLRYSY
ncbi:MAG: hypothetical protein J7527_06995, partial [Chitinophagaceae bacterium]|nr:hypothetical protein [Chitinophagaceae bacterium]